VRERTRTGRCAVGVNRRSSPTGVLGGLVVARGLGMPRLSDIR